MALVDAKVVERLAHVEVGLAGGDDAEARRRRIDHGAVEGVGAGEGERGVEPVGVEPPLLVERVVGPADVETAGGHLEILRSRDGDALRPDLDRGGAFDGLRDQLEPGPHPGVARQRQSQRAIIDDLLHVRGVQHRHHRRHEGVFGLVGAGRGLGGVVVSGERQHPAVRRGAGEVGVLEHVARTVDPRPLAVPQAEHPLVAGAAEQPGLLAAPYRGGGEVLVDAGLEADVVAIEKARRAPQLLIVGAERRAAIARHEPRGIPTRRSIAPALRQRHPHQRLDAGEEHPARLGGVLVIQRYIGEGEGHIRNIC